MEKYHSSVLSSQTVRIFLPDRKAVHITKEDTNIRIFVRKYIALLLYVVTFAIKKQ